MPIQLQDTSTLKQVVEMETEAKTAQLAEMALTA